MSVMEFESLDKITEYPRVRAQFIASSLSTPLGGDNAPSYRQHPLTRNKEEEVAFCGILSAEVYGQGYYQTINGSGRDDSNINTRRLVFSSTEIVCSLTYVSCVFVVKLFFYTCFSKRTGFFIFKVNVVFFVIKFFSPLQMLLENPRCKATAPVSRCAFYS